MPKKLYTHFVAGFTGLLCTSGICIALLLPASHFTRLAAQDRCIDFESYRQSQDWIDQLNQLSANERKDSLIKRLYCENLLNDNVTYKLMWGFEGVLVAKIPKQRFHLVEQIDPNGIILLNSICEAGIYPQKCNLGTALVDCLVVNSSNQIEVASVGRKNGSTHIKLKAKEKSVVLLTVENFEVPGYYIFQPPHTKERD